MPWDQILFVAVPGAGLVLVGGLQALRHFLFRDQPGVVKARWTQSPAHDIVTDLPRGLRRLPSGDIRLAHTWLDSPALLGRWFGPWGWLVLALGTMTAVNLALLVVEREASLVPSMTAKTLCIGLIPLALVYSRRLLGDWLACLLDFVELRTEEVIGWFASQLQALFLAPVNMLLGVFVGCLILVFEYRDGAFTQTSPWTLGVVLLASLMMTMLAGFALVVMVKGAILISRVGQLPIYVTTSPYGVLRTGTVLAEAFSVATGVYVVALLTMVLRTWSRPTLPILAWAISVAGLYVAMFVLPQWTIHKRMLQFKRDRLNKVERSLKKQLEVFDVAPTKATSDVIEALRKRRDEVQNLPEWPFNWKNFTSVLGLAASSTLPIVLKTVFASTNTWILPVVMGAKSP